MFAFKFASAGKKTNIYIYFCSYRRLLAAHFAACFKINLWKFITTYNFDGSKIQCQSSSHHNGSITLDRYQMSLSQKREIQVSTAHSGCRYVQLRRLHMQFKKASIMGRVTATAVIAVNAIRVMIMPVITLTFKLEQSGELITRVSQNFIQSWSL